MTYNKRDYGLFILRLVVGIIFSVHGYQKLTGIQGTTGFFSQVGIPLAGFFSYVVGLVELLGGIALILGILVKLASYLLAIDMVAAIIYVHLPNGLTGQGGYEFPLLLLASIITLILLGKGKLSLQSLFAKKS
jgi:putative oxidoreductase